MPRTQHKLITALVAALALVLLTAAGAAVDVSSEDIQVDDGENVTVDVEVTDEFINDGQTSASVDVQLKDDTGSVVNSTTLSVDDTAFDGTYSGSDTVFRTAEFAPAEAGNYTVVVNATAQDYVNSTNTEVGTTATGGGLIGGASSTGLLAFAAVVGGLAYAYREDYL
jgi:hypothetical protein